MDSEVSVDQEPVWEIVVHLVFLLLSLAAYGTLMYFMIPTPTAMSGGFGMISIFGLAAIVGIFQWVASMIVSAFKG